MHLEGANERVLDDPAGIEYLDLHDLIEHLRWSLSQVEVEHLAERRGRRREEREEEGGEGGGGRRREEREKE